MNFSTVLEALTAGKKARRPCNYTISYDPEKDGIIQEGHYFVATSKDLLATDWEIIEDPPEVKLHIKEYFTCPRCGYENVGFHLDNGNSKCVKCGMGVKTLPRDEGYADEYKKWLKKMIKDYEFQIQIYVRDKQYERAGIFDRSRDTFQTCLNMLERLESENSN